MDTVLIVGASSGIGYELTKKFLSEGYNVAALSRTECVLAGVKNYLCDVALESKLDEILTAVISENPKIKYAVYCAGFSMASPLEKVDPADYRYLFEVNFFGFLHCLRRLVPLLRRNEGTACVVSSLSSVAPIPFDSYYVASKAALNAFCTALQTELSPRGVRVISVMPGGTRTNFSYKRKVYPPAAIGDYKTAQENSVKKLEKMEQTGQRVERVAVAIYEKCTQKSGAYLFTIGIRNKIIRWLVRVIPQPLLTLLTKEVFLSPVDQETITQANP